MTYSDLATSTRLSKSSKDILTFGKTANGRGGKHALRSNNNIEGKGGKDHEDDQ
jgi:hypothetical protein